MLTYGEVFLAALCLTLAARVFLYRHEVRELGRAVEYLAAFHPSRGGGR